MAQQEQRANGGIGVHTDQTLEQLRLEKAREAGRTTKPAARDGREDHHHYEGGCYRHDALGRRVLITAEEHADGQVRSRQQKHVDAKQPNDEQR